MVAVVVFVFRGMARFRSGRVAASIADFDRAVSLQPRLAPYMWQRGLSLYYGELHTFEGLVLVMVVHSLACHARLGAAHGGLDSSGVRTALTVLL